MFGINVDRSLAGWLFAFPYLVVCIEPAPYRQAEKPGDGTTDQERSYYFVMTHRCPASDWIAAYEKYMRQK
jgi:hypothetical protein